MKSKSIKSLIDQLELWKKDNFEHRGGPRHIPYKLPACIIVESKSSTFTKGTKWQTDLDQRPHISVFPITIRCEKNVILLHLFH